MRIIMRLVAVLVFAGGFAVAAMADASAGCTTAESGVHAEVADRGICAGPDGNQDCNDGAICLSVTGDNGAGAVNGCDQGAVCVTGTGNNGSDFGGCQRESTCVSGTGNNGSEWYGCVASSRCVSGTGDNGGHEWACSDNAVCVTAGGENGPGNGFSDTCESSTCMSPLGERPTSVYVPSG